MKTKFLLLVASVLVLTVSSVTYSGYYYNWYSSCEGDEECDDNSSIYYEGSGSSECECKSHGAWSTCEEVKNPDSLCIAIWEVGEDCDDLSLFGIDKCDICISP